MRATLYIEPASLFCQLARDFLSAQGIPFEEKDVSQDEEAIRELRAIGVLAVPVIVLDQHVVIGFDQEKLATLIGE
jgi:glutaredoxin